MTDNRPLQKSSVWDLLQHLTLPIWTDFIHKTSPSSLSKPLAQCPYFCICNPPLILMQSREKHLRTLWSYYFQSIYVLYFLSFGTVLPSPGVPGVSWGALGCFCYCFHPCSSPLFGQTARLPACFQGKALITFPGFQSAGFFHQI